MLFFFCAKVRALAESVKRRVSARDIVCLLVILGLLGGVVAMNLKQKEEEGVEDLISPDEESFPSSVAS